jgi:hypothetical protein
MTTSTRSNAPIPFREPDIAAAPAAPGVYFLSRGCRVIFIGVATDGTRARRAMAHGAPSTGSYTRLNDGLRALPVLFALLAREPECFPGNTAHPRR